VVEGDPRLFNPYGVILVNPKLHPHVKSDDARAFSDWLVSPIGQAAITAFQIDGKQVFFANAQSSK
jgi:tungstate transport system substrate-binding protein